jgi:LEA14-like dessication related protein
MKLISRFLLLCSAFALFAGCLGNPELNSIAVNILSIKRMAGSQELQVNLRYANGNVVPVGVTSTEHALYLNGKFIGKIKSANPVGLPPEKTADETIIIRPEKPEVINDLAGKVVSYKIESRLLVLNGEDHITIKTENSGPVDLSKL